MSGSDPWPQVAEEDLGDFHTTADTFLNVANTLVATEPPERAGAAFLYACARFSAFALESEADGRGVAAAVRDGLADRFQAELRDHMAQFLRPDPGAFVMPQNPPDAAIDVLMSINGMEELPRRAFLKLADTFIHPANGMIDDSAVPWVAAAMMHACTRFNGYVMQARGLPAGPLDDTIAADFRQAFRVLLDFHLGDSVVTDRA